MVQIGGQKRLNSASLAQAGRYGVRLAAGARDRARALALRARLFRGTARARDGDGFDAGWQHVVVEDRGSGALVGTCRFSLLAAGGEIADSYAAQFYDLTALGAYPAPMLELGRVCAAPEADRAGVMRLTWAALGQIVAAERVEMLFGCSSFAGGTEPAPLDAFAHLHARHNAPRQWRPGVKAPEVIRFDRLGPRRPDPKRALRALPPLLRSYLAMGGWVSDHAVRDRDLGTLHVFTGLELGRMPAGRRAALLGA